MCHIGGDQDAQDLEDNLKDLQEERPFAVSREDVVSVSCSIHSHTEKR